MKTVRVLAIAWSLFLSSHLVAQSEVEQAAAEMLSNGNTGVEAIRAQVEQARNKVAAAISKVARDGKLNSSTEAYFRDVLAKFETVPGDLPNFVQASYPPRFDSSPEMEPVNSAWDEFRKEMERAQAGAAKLGQVLLAQCGEAIQKLARTATKPEELTAAQGLAELCAKLPSSSPRAGPEASPGEGLKNLLDSMAGALDAAQRNDAGRLAVALQRNVLARGSGLRTPGMPISPEAIWTEFRTRLSERFRATARQAQAAVEKAIMERKSPAECEVLIAAFSQEAARMEQVTRDTTRIGMTAPTSESLGRLISTYRTAIDVSQTPVSATEDDLTYRNSLSPPAPTATLPIGEDFRAFLVKLKAQRAAQLREAQAAAETQRRLDQEKEAKVQSLEEEARRKEEESARRAAQTAERDQLRKELALIHTPEDAISLTARWQRPSPNVSRAATEENEFAQERRTIIRELQRIVRWWLNPIYQLQGAGEEPVSPETDGGELGRVRDVAIRDVMANRYDAPELVRPPLNSLPARAAIQKLAEDLADAGEWLRAYQLAKESAAAEDAPAVARSTVEMTQAIRSYLKGLNFEQAGLTAEAGQAFREVLEHVGQHLPTAAATEHLRNLRTATPPPKSRE